MTASKQKSFHYIVAGLFIVVFLALALPILAAPTMQTACTSPAWSSSAIYVNGDQVSHNGHEWQAKWWTQNEEPGTTGEWGVWEDLGPCSGGSTNTPLPPTATPTNTLPGSCSAPQYVAGTTYSAGQEVQNIGNRYRCDVAGWCSSSAAWAYEPGVGMHWETAWTFMGVCDGGGDPTNTPAPPTATSVPPTATPGGGSCNAPAWSSSAVYVNGDVVSHNSHEWQARWWTQGEEPGTTGPDGVWLDLGACTGGPTSTPPPTSTPAGPTPTPLPTIQPPGGKEIVAYFTQWGIYSRNYHVKNIVTSGSAEDITIINYAFANIVDGECIMTTQTGVMDAYADYQKSYMADQSVDGVADVWNQPLKGNFNQLRKLKQMYPHIKVLISIGGWTWSKGFSDAALTAASRQQLVESCIDIYIHGNLPVEGGAGGLGAAAGVFDGIDIDWEYPAAPGDPGTPYRPEDTQNFTLLLQEFRTQLDAIDPNLLLTIAAPAGIDKYEKIELDQIHQYLDWINLMTYDMHGAWENTTNFHAPVYTSPNDPSSYPANYYSLHNAVQDYLAAGVPADKLIVGLPFYGRGWTGVTNANNGLYQSASGPAPGTYEAGIEDYKVLKNLSYPSFRDSITGAYWIFNGSTFWSYDDPVSLSNKTNYINVHSLRGAMIWSLDGDDANGTLMNAVANGLQ